MVSEAAMSIAVSNRNECILRTYECCKLVQESVHYEQPANGDTSQNVASPNDALLVVGGNK